MKFRTLEMPAFGPFTDFKLELPDDPSFHVLYGPNESGKSSTLRAIRGLLYGIERRSPDNFIHQHAQMKVGGTLQHSDGRQLEVIRRKGLKDTLLSPEGTPLEEALLTNFLGGLSKDVFDRIYGLDHLSLVSGGKALLNEGGKVGESLFAASVGPHFRELLSQLSQEAKDLWGPRSSTKVVNRALKGWNEATKEIRQASLAATTWEKVYSELQEVRSLEKSLAEEIRALDVDIRQRQRWQRAAPLVSHRQDLKKELARFAGLPQLSSDFPQRRAQVLNELDRGKQKLKWNSESQANSRKTLEQLPQEWPVLAFSSAMQALEQRVGLVEESQRLLPQLGRELKTLHKRRQRLHRDLGYSGEPDTALPDAPLRVRTRRLVARYTTLQQQLEHDNETHKRTRDSFEQLSKELEALVDFVDLEAAELALRKAGKQLGLDTQIESLQQRIPNKASQARAQFEELPSFQGTAEQLKDLKVPQKLTIRSFEDALHELAKVAERAELEAGRAESEHRALLEELEQLQSGDRIPSRARLKELRNLRDERWAELKELFFRGQNPEESDFESFESLQQSADRFSDRMLSEATLVANLEKLQSRAEAARQRLKSTRSSGKHHAQKLKAKEKEWKALWESEFVLVRPPREMRAWSEQRDHILATYRELEQLQVELEVARQKRLAELRRLQESWTPQGKLEGETLSEALEMFEAQIGPLRESNLKRPRLESELAQADDNLEKILAKLEEAEEELADWGQEWSSVLERYALPEEPTPAELELLLEKFEELEDLGQREEQLRQQQQRCQAEVDDFQGQLGKLQEQLQLPTSVALGDLKSRLQKATQEKSKRDDAEAQLQELQVGAREIQFRLEEVSGQLGSLLAEAEVDKLEALRRLEPKVLRRSELQHQLRAVEESLRQLSGGQALDEFCQSVRKADMDALVAELERLDESKSALEARRDQSLARSGELSREKEMMDGTQAAAEAAQRASQFKAEGSEAVRSYVRLALAESVLRREIERYRKENEGPVLRAASHYFSRLTCGAYRELETGYDEKVGPVLLCVATSGRRVQVEGLSDGTRDQLFLALRLATIRQSLDKQEPLPLIADDLLVHFDSERAEATLSVLAEFAGHTQVLLFTHLSRDRDLANKLPRGAVQLTELAPTRL